MRLKKKRRGEERGGEGKGKYQKCALSGHVSIIDPKRDVFGQVAGQLMSISGLIDFAFLIRFQTQIWHVAGYLIWIFEILHLAGHLIWDLADLRLM